MKRQRREEEEYDDNSKDKGIVDDSHNDINHPINDNDNDNDDDHDRFVWLRFLNDDQDGFLDDETHSAKQAELRRQQRRQRLSQHRSANEEDTTATATTTTTITNPIDDQSSTHEMESRSISAAATITIRTTHPESEEPAGSLDHDVDDIMEKDKDDDDEEFDMFSDTSPPMPPQTAATNTGRTLSHPVVNSDTAVATTATETNHHHHHHHQHPGDFDDAEGYYKAVIGEVMELEPNYSLKVLGVIGKGVFSTVLKCQLLCPTLSFSSLSSSELELELESEVKEEVVTRHPVVALKCIRNNESMAQAALHEMAFLQQLADAPGIVKLLRPSLKKEQQSQSHSQSQLPCLYYRGHVVLVLSYSEYNLRTVLQKFGRGVGLSLVAVKSYLNQLLLALQHLHQHNILHADLKPDNILISADFECVSIADFGSALSKQVNDVPTVPSPYLVSRFYRAPEIILHLLPLTSGIDLWSVAVTMAELFTGNVLFRGTSNNEMLQWFMQVLRTAIPNRLLKQHVRTAEKYTLPVHFVSPQGPHTTGSHTLMFQQEIIDPVTKKPFYRHVPLQQLVSENKNHNIHNNNNKNHQKHVRASLTELLYKAAGKSQHQHHHHTSNHHHVGALADLLHKCLLFDPAKRIDLRSALKHEFFVQHSTSTHHHQGVPTTIPQSISVHPTSSSSSS